MATGICPFCGKKVDKFIMFRGDIVGCQYCGINTKRTNADRIRAMSDEEMADELAISGCPKTHFTKNDANFDCPAEREPCEQDCVKCWLDWLKQEAT